MNISAKKRQYKDTGSDYISLIITYGGHPHEFELSIDQARELVSKVGAETQA